MSRLRASATDVPQLIRALTRAGGGGNVTVPHKEVAALAVDQPSDRVRTLGACNTFWGGEGGARGDNTDVDGVLASLELLEAPASAWLIAGTGRRRARGGGGGGGAGGAGRDPFPRRGSPRGVRGLGPGAGCRVGGDRGVRRAHQHHAARTARR